MFSFYATLKYPSGTIRKILVALNSNVNPHRQMEKLLKDMGQDTTIILSIEPNE